MRVISFPLPIDLAIFIHVIYMYIRVYTVVYKYSESRDINSHCGIDNIAYREPHTVHHVLEH